MPLEPTDTQIAAHGFLDPDDAVAISFWIISIAMVAATVFFLMESMNVGAHWKTSLNVGALVTVLLQMVEFYLILKAVQPSLGMGMFARLLLGTVFKQLVR